MEADDKNFGGNWKVSMRARITLDVTKPLKRKMKIKRVGGEWNWVNFKNERLPTFCYFCGRMGHAEHSCERLYATKDPNVEKPYGAWIRAPGRQAAMNIGERWLRVSPPDSYTEG